MAGVCLSNTFAKHCHFFASQIMHINHTCTVCVLGPAVTLLLLKVRLSLFHRAFNLQTVCV